MGKLTRLVSKKAVSKKAVSKKPSPPWSPEGKSPAELLSHAMGGTASLDRYQELLPAVAQCLKECGCDSPKRIAMWLAQVGNETGGLRTWTEDADGSKYEHSKILGNTKDGDGPRFKGRGATQVTGRYNYTKFSEWAFEKGLVPSKTFFVDNPTKLASDQYGFLAAVWTWTKPDRYLNVPVKGKYVTVKGGKKVPKTILTPFPNLMNHWADTGNVKRPRRTSSMGGITASTIGSSA